MNALVMGWACYRMCVRPQRQATSLESTDADLPKRVVDGLMAHQLVRVPRWMQRWERAMYVSIVTCVYETLFRELQDTDVSFLDHRVSVDVQPLSPDHALEASLVDTDWTFFRALVDVYMDRNPRLHVFGLPRGIERRVYANILGTIIGVLDVVLQSVRVSVLGHAFTIRSRSLSPDELHASLCRAHTTPTCPKDAHRSLQRIVDRHVHEHPIAWVPNRLHRAALYQAFRVVRALSAEVLETSRLDLLDHRIGAWFRPATDANANEEPDLHQHKRNTNADCKKMSANSYTETP